MRKIVLATAAVAGIFALSACKGEEAAPAPTETAITEAAPVETAAATDAAATEAAATEAPKM